MPLRRARPAVAVMVDYHMHLRGPDETVELTPEAIARFLETAAVRGVDEVGFTEHVYYFRQTLEIWALPYQIERCVYDLDAYCDVVLDAKRQGLPVKLGLEVDYVGDRQERLTELLASYPWDFLLGSVHYVDELAIDQEPGLWAECSVAEVWRRYVDAVITLARNGSVDVLAHPDLAKIYSRKPEPRLLDELHEQLAEAVAETGVVVEISTAGLRKPVGELYPDEALLRACVERGARITTASDAHTPDLVGFELPRALALARETGCETVTVFEGRQGRQEPLG